MIISKKESWHIHALLAVVFLISSFTSCKKDGLDTTAPSVFILNPTSEDIFVTTDNKITVSGVAQDDNGVRSVTYSSNHGVSGKTKGLEEWVIPDFELTEGDNVIEIKAVDKNKNEGTARITITKNKYLVFLGVPFINKNIIFTNVNTQVWITASIVPNEHLIESSVRLIAVDEANNEISEVCQMYDDGSLSHGDEIKGDNTFSAIHSFKLDKEGVFRYRVSAKSNEDGEEVEGFSSVFTITVMDEETAHSQVEELMATQQAIENMMKELAGQELTADEIERILREFLEKQDNIETVERIGYYLQITYKSGFVSFIELETQDEMKGGTLDQLDTLRRRNAAIPLSSQTRGVNASVHRQSAPFLSSPTKEESDNFILNKKVLIWAPYENQFSIDMEPDLRPIFDKSPVNFSDSDIDYLKNDQCTIQSLENLANYGIIVFDTHGLAGHYVSTRHLVIYTEDLNWGLVDDHEALGLLTGEYSISTKSSGDSYYLVTSEFFRQHILGTLPNSVVFNGSCESMKTDRLANAFITKGARTYLGFRESVLTSNCNLKAKEFFGGLLGNDLLTTGEAYDISTVQFDETTSDGTIRHNEYLIRGSRDMRFYLGLLNGDFEQGNMGAWSTTGDGRVITSLGSLRPTQGTFMGIVSTGLGFTEDYGRISQSFYISDESKLSVKWNFLSEEFLEYVGSRYQDYLKMTISDGTNTVNLFEMAIDGIATQFSLSCVSPGIVFDQGDVYMTGWQTSNFDISAFKGKTVTLVIESGDIGDSIYDSATLLDEISLE